MKADVIAGSKNRDLLHLNLQGLEDLVNLKKAKLMKADVIAGFKNRDLLLLNLKGF
jgi:hypothetical protein